VQLLNTRAGVSVIPGTNNNIHPYSAEEYKSASREATGIDAAGQLNAMGIMKD
jgi:hypothetical protein